MLQALNSEMLSGSPSNIAVLRFELSGAEPFDDLNWLVAIRQYDTLRTLKVFVPG
jgi:hypothetical protein